MFEWWNSLGLAVQVFYCVAVPSTLLLVIQTVMLLHNSTYAPDGLSIAGILETLNALDLSSHPDRAEFRDLLTRIGQ